MNITLNATVQDGKITLDINDLLKLIQQDKLTEVEYEIEPKPMAFDTKKELDDYFENNPNATCKGVPTEELVAFINKNKGKFLFLKDADLRDADLRGANLCFANLCFANLFDANLCFANLCGADLCFANLCGADLCGANLFGADLCGADLCGANLCFANLFDAKYNDKTRFSAFFTIPTIMIKI